MDEQACYERLVAALHPDGLACPRCGGDRFNVHRRRRDPVVDYRCRDCRKVFNAFTNTALQKAERRPTALVLILSGVSTARPARELGCDRMKLPALRHKLQEGALAGLNPDPLPDAVVEADECYANAGGKRDPAPRPRRPAATPGR